MERVIEFIINHWILVSTFLFCLTGLIIVEGQRAGTSVSNIQATQLINKESAVVVDIREPKEFNKGHITDAVNISYATFKTRVDELSVHKGKPIILVCAMGQHSGTVGKILRANGFSDIRRLQGGIAGWQGENLPLVKS